MEVWEIHDIILKMEKNQELVDFIINNKVDLTQLLNCASFHDIDLVKFLLEKFSHKWKLSEALYWSASAANKDIYKLLISKGASQDFEVFLEHRIFAGEKLKNELEKMRSLIGG